MNTLTWITMPLIWWLVCIEAMGISPAPLLRGIADDFEAVPRPTDA